VAIGKSVILHFESVRQRADIVPNGALVGCGIIGNTPLEVDIAGKGRLGALSRLAVRLTDPGGNSLWEDPSSRVWGSDVRATNVRAFATLRHHCTGSRVMQSSPTICPPELGFLPVTSTVKAWLPAESSTSPRAIFGVLTMPFP
jgi:hypothetical protein